MRRKIQISTSDTEFVLKPENIIKMNYAKAIKGIKVAPYVKRIDSHGESKSTDSGEVDDSAGISFV